MEKSIRVLVANHPRLMREIVLTTFADQPDIEIVGEVADESDISASVKKTLPNVVVIALDQPGVRPRICDELLREHPGGACNRSGTGQELHRLLLGFVRDLFEQYRGV